jgi:hypothetical protein
MRARFIRSSNLQVRRNNQSLTLVLPLVCASIGPLFVPSLLIEEKRQKAKDDDELNGIEWSVCDFPKKVYAPQKKEIVVVPG